MNAKGFTLVEVLIGLIILAIGLLGVAGMQINSVQGNFFSRNLSQATFAAKDRLEFLKNLPLDAPQMQGSDPADLETTIAGITYRGSYTIAVNGSLRMIDYTVTWNDGTNHSISFSTVRSK